MRDSTTTALCLAAAGLAGLAAATFAQVPTHRVAHNTAVSAAAEQSPKFNFILFWKEKNPKTDRITAELTAALANHADRASWTAVNVHDAAQRELVERYQVSRVPLPLVLCVAPNGAVTGVMPGRVTESAVEKALVTPTMTRCMKSLQAGKIVVVHVQPEANLALPEGASQFMADPAFQNRTATESFVVNDPAEARFLRDMEFDAASASGSTVVVLAPPGVLVGKFAATATSANIATKLHAAGKCCDDPNCKHNH